MGNTCASLHIAWRRNLDDLTKAIVRSYGRLGFERVKKAPPPGAKHVILRANSGQPFVSLYDGDNAQLDNGELKDLAMAASKALKTAIVFTSLYDSDRYEFIVFANGRQVDLSMTDAESYTGPLKRLSDKSRATQWSALFGRPLTAAQIAPAAAPAAFAENTLSALCALVGLSAGRTQINYQDFLDGGEEITAQFHFTKKPVAASDFPAGEIRFASAYDPDDTRMLLVYPASWPIPVGKPANVRWMILSQGAGFNGGMATLQVSGPPGLVLSKGAMRGFKFHNGQIVGDLETRPTDQDHVPDYFAFAITPLDPSPGSQSYRAGFPRLSIPPNAPGRTTQILILLVLFDLQSQTPGEWEINVSLQPGTPGEYRYHLPPLRLAAVEQKWLPVVSGLNPNAAYKSSGFSSDPRSEQNYVRELQDKQTRIVDDRLLVHPAITSSVAILDDRGQVTLDACKIWLETWLRPLSGQGRGELRIETEKKLPERVFKANKTRKTVPVAAFLEDKSWAGFFDYSKGYQSIVLAYIPPGGDRAVAGMGMQFSHERHYFPGDLNSPTSYEGQMAKTLSIMRGRPFPEEEYRCTLHAYLWIINHQDCYRYFNTSPADMAQLLDTFAAGNAPLQAWQAQATWVPLFDQAAHGQFTLYEKASAINWFRGVYEGAGLHRRITSTQWCGNVLRMMAPNLWLCRNLIDQVNRAALEQVAHVTEVNGVYKVELRSGRHLDELELALLPILPIESARISVLPPT